MSQLRKSASFRSRIPVRRTRYTRRRRCYSPCDCVGADATDDYAETPFRLRTNKSFAFDCARRTSARCNANDGDGYDDDDDYNARAAHHNYSSSTYSSSDESLESEAPYQRIVKQYTQVSDINLMHISADAVSLDGLLDNISCGSTFSSPPSPVQYQNVRNYMSKSVSYDSLHKFHTDLEQSANIINDLTVPIGLSAIQAHVQWQQFNAKIQSENANKQIMDNLSSMKAVSAAKEISYSDKQRNLSDWYYIKTKSRAPEEIVTNVSNKAIIEHHIDDDKHEEDDDDNDDVVVDDVQVELEDEGREGEAVKAFNATVAHKAQSLPRLAANVSSDVYRKQIKWNNFGAMPKYANVLTGQQAVAAVAGAVADKSSVNVHIESDDNNYDDDGDDCDDNDNVNVVHVNDDEVAATKQELAESEQTQSEQRQQQKTTSKFSINGSLPRERLWSHATTKNRKHPPYYCPPAYSTLEHQHQQQQQRQNHGDINAVGKVNIKFLKEQYEQHQQQTQQAGTIEYKTGTSGRNKSQRVEQQLRHWEKLGSNRKQQHLQQQQHELGDENYAAADHREKDQNKKHQVERRTFASMQRADKSSATAALEMPGNGQNSRLLSSDELQQQQQYQQPIAAPRRFMLQPPNSQPSTPRPALRSMKMMKDQQSHETSTMSATVCNSFEQLDIVGVPVAKLVGRLGLLADKKDAMQQHCSVEKLHELDKNGKFSAETSFEVGKGSTQATQSVLAPSHTLQHVRALRHVEHLEVKRPPGSPLLSTRTLPLTPVEQQQQQQQQKQQQVQIKLQQNPVTRQLFGVVQSEVFNPKNTIYRSDGELSGSYASLECPSPPGPPACLPEAQRDPQARLSNFLRNLYQELSFKEPVIPPWVMPIAPGNLYPARLELDLRLNANSHGFSDSLTVDQILVSMQTKEGNFLEAPRRCLVECPTWASRSNVCLRILHAWAKDPPWPAKGTPVALTLFIPLRELKRNFALYIEKELLPKGRTNPFATGTGGFSAAWTSLEALGPKLLIILDGYVGQKHGNGNTNSIATPKRFKTVGIMGGGGGSANKCHYPSDVQDLLEGKLFPEARVIITTNSSNCSELMPLVQRHVMCDGLTWGRSASILEGGQWNAHSRMLDVIQNNTYLRNAVRTPLGCLAIAAIYDASNGDLPMEELDVIESILNCVAPDASSTSISELGRLALFCIKMKRSCVTMAEIKMYCSETDSVMGCLERNVLYGKTAKKKAEYVFNPICPNMMEFLSANYIASLANRPGLLAAEITGMAIGDELDPELLKVLKFAMALLGDRAHILLSRLTPLWLTPQIVFSLALAGGQGESNLAALCDILGISKHPPISPLETKPLWVQVRSMPTDLMGWGMALKSPTCTLKNLEIIYQLEKQNLADSRKAIEIFLDSIILNESVSTLRLSSLIEMDVKDSEIAYLSNCVSKLLLKPRLENFELVLTLIEEDPPMLKLQSVVAALCRTIPRQPKLNSLLLDLGLSTSQLVQLCSAIEQCPHITRLSLPHLRCERGAIAALSSLLNEKPISFLSLPSCWGARDDPPSSSGVSMGSGSGSSTGTSCLIKQGSLPGVPSPRSYAPGIFSSLPRGVFVPQSTLGRSATLPRQPLEQTAEKRSCDSVVSKMWYPTPTCDGGPHNSGTMHDLFLAIRSKLHGLDLSKAQLSLEDSMCLGETVRLSNTLHTLKFEGASRISEILPTILGACESPCLQMLSLCSQRLSLEDSVVVMCARALTSCSTLRLLSLDGWCFRIEHSQTFSILRVFLSLTSIRELSLANCRLQASLIRKDYKPLQLFESRSLVVLKLAGAQVTLADLTVLRGPQLLPFIGGFPCLRELDLSAPTRSGIESTHTTALVLDDKCVVQFFQSLHSYFGLLNTLKICNWVIHLDDLSKTLKAISKALRNSLISHLKLDGVYVLDRPKKQRSEAAYIHCFITSLPQLRWLGISLSNKKEEQIAAIGNSVLDLKGNEIEIKLSESTIEQAKLIAQAISLDGKFDIKVSTFGTSSGILIHAEKCGMKSLTRKTKDQADQYF